jgi:lipoprotein-releasing system ATP-binding protein
MTASSDHVPQTASGAAPILVAERLSKTYRMGRVRVPVLRDASIAVHRGEWVAVVGLSGSGKSTLLHLLGGLDRPDAPESSESRPASIRFAESASSSIDVTGLSAAGLNRYRARSVGFVFQFYHLLPELTVLENAMLPAMTGRTPFAWLNAGPIRKRAAELLRRFGLGHRLTHRPNELSGGERQRTAIARALVNGPKLLLADEPTGNLDARTGGEILEVIRELHREGLTILMVTHDRSIASMADRIVSITDGRIADEAASLSH